MCRPKKENPTFPRRPVSPKHSSEGGSAPSQAVIALRWISRKMGTPKQTIYAALARLNFSFQLSAMKMGKNEGGNVFATLTTQQELNNAKTVGAVPAYGNRYVFTPEQWTKFKAMNRRSQSNEEDKP